MTSAPHPQACGAPFRALGHCRDIGLFTLGTGGAQDDRQARLVFPPRHGAAAAGHVADLVVFDADTIADKGHVRQLTRQAEGIDYVLVNGNVAWRGGGKHRGAEGKVIWG